MTGRRSDSSHELDVGALSRPELQAALNDAGVLLNDAAEVLLANAAFDRQTRDRFVVVERTVRQLGFESGAVLSAIFARASRLGLSLCPPTTGPYLRLAVMDQESAPDSIMSKGSAPSASITVASAPLVSDDEYPKGFYLRVVEGVPWLRGYWTGDEHVWAPDDCFAFRQAEVSRRRHLERLDQPQVKQGTR